MTRKTMKERVADRAARIQADMRDRARRRRDKSAFPEQEGFVPDNQ